MLKVENISFSYPKLIVLDKISFRVKKGEILALVGPIGCGKTTLLKILGGLLTPKTGTVFLANNRLTKPTNKISFCFQKPSLLPWLTTEQNIGLPLKIKGESPSKIKQKVNQIINLIKLKKYRAYYPNSLSGGLEQLTSLARAFITDSTILLLDEPFANLDALTREKMNLKLLGLWQKTKKTIILVTHSIEEAVFLSDRVLILSPKPAKIIKEQLINLPRPRQPKISYTPQFISYLRLIKPQLKTF